MRHASNKHEELHDEGKAREVIPVGEGMGRERPSPAGSDPCGASLNKGRSAMRWDVKGQHVEQ